jgi:5-methylcytosine-specific restriction endonuclease McrA
LRKIRSARAKQVIKPGRRHSEESKEKNRIAHLGIAQTMESNMKRSKSLLGVSKSEDHKNNIAKSKKKEKNPSWKGGITDFPYSQDWTEDLKDAIRKRDGFSCQLCDRHKNGEGVFFKKLDVHHIDYNKENCDPENLVALCHSCHGKTHHNRAHWLKYFHGKLRVVVKQT